MKILIIGLGLIGSSLARAIKKGHPNYYLIGSDTNQASLKYAQSSSLVDETTTDFTTSALRADVIILATPVQMIIADLQILSQLPLKPQVLITDVGSTKQQIMQAAQAVQKRGFTFIGGHPMAGSHRSGVAAGSVQLLENAFYFLVPEATSSRAVSQLKNLLCATHNQWLVVDSRQHDRIVGQISHLPHIMAAALVNQAQTELQDFPLGLKIAAGGFKSTTRIASSDPQMWTDILLTNNHLLITQLQDYIQKLIQIKKALQNQDPLEIKAFFTKARDTRQQLTKNPNKEFCLTLTITAVPEAIKNIVDILFSANLNLINIHISPIKQDNTSHLQLSFNNQTNLSKATNLLKAAGYQILGSD